MSRAEPDRLVIFGDPNLTFSRLLLPAYLHSLRSRDDVKLVAVFDTSRKPTLAEPWASSAAWLRQLVRRAFNSSLRGQPAPILGRHLYSTARQSGVPIIVPPERNVNHPEFIDQLRSIWRPTLALSLGCLQIFKPSLLDVFDMAVNFHDGYLPCYKGLAATAWSLYQRESHTGYSYHILDSGIDSGSVLVQNRIPVPCGATPSTLRLEKTRIAARDANRVLDMMVGRYRGNPQRESGSYFSAADRRRIAMIDDPSQVSSDEFQHRLRCFEILRVRIDGQLCEVTELTQSASRYSFRTKNGVTLGAHRMLWFPPWLYFFYRRLRPASN